MMGKDSKNLFKPQHNAKIILFYLSLVAFSQKHTIFITKIQVYMFLLFVALIITFKLMKSDTIIFCIVVSGCKGNKNF